MSRKQKAIEERYRNRSSIITPKVSRDELRAAMGMTEKRRAEEEYERTRPCTLEDVISYIEKYDNGFWMYTSSFMEKHPWRRERDDIISIARIVADKVYVRDPNLHPWEIDPNWTKLFKEHAKKEWTRRQSKLYKALR